jgi:hypothetical protein
MRPASGWFLPWLLLGQLNAGKILLRKLGWFSRTIPLDCLCGLVIRIPGYRSKGPGSIPGTTRFSEKQSVWNWVHPALWIQLRSYLKEKVASPVWKPEYTVVEIRLADHATPLSQQKLALTPSTSGVCWVGIVRTRANATEFNLMPLYIPLLREL